MHHISDRFYLSPSSTCWKVFWHSSPYKNCTSEFVFIIFANEEVAYTNMPFWSDPEWGEIAQLMLSNATVLITSTGYKAIKYSPPPSLSFLKNRENICWMWKHIIRSSEGRERESFMGDLKQLTLNLSLQACCKNGGGGVPCNDWRLGRMLINFYLFNRVI